MALAVGLHFAEAVAHHAPHALGVVQDHLVALRGRRADGVAQETVDLLEIGRGGRRSRQHQGKRHGVVGGIEQHAEHVEDLFGRADAARKDDDAVPEAGEGFQPFLDVRQDHQLVDQRVGRLGGDDAGLGDAHVAAVADALLAVRHRGALHRPLHRARPAAGADVQPAQPQVVAHALGVIVFLAADGVAAPAHHQVGCHPGAQDAGVAQQAEHGVGDAGAGVVGGRLFLRHVAHVDHVAQHGEQVLANAAHQLAVDEGLRRRVAHAQADAALHLQQLDLEVGEAFVHRARVVQRAAGVQHRQRAAAEQRLQAAVADVAQLGHLQLGEQVHAAHGRDGDGVAQLVAHGRMWIGVPSATASQMSIMAELLTAMQPSVQSDCR